jgi:hypothetical protein
MAMSSRIPALLALALLLCALPGVRAFASAMPCCEATEPGTGCAPAESDCCTLVPAAPAAPSAHVKAQPGAPAVVSVLRAFAPAPAALRSRHSPRDSAPAPSALRLSVVRLL